MLKSEFRLGGKLFSELIIEVNARDWLHASAQYQYEAMSPVSFLIIMLTKYTSTNHYKLSLQTQGGRGILESLHLKYSSM